MEDGLLAWIKKIQADRSLELLGDEAKTKQIVILRILSLLGWDIHNIDEVCPEYTIGNNRVDYSLRYQNQNKVFIEVKKVGIDLENENHQEQLLNYSFHHGVKLAILTNGISWWLYLPLREGGWEQRKFYTIELHDQDPSDIVQKFFTFLSKETVISGLAIENAENLFKSKQKELLIQENLPKAWNKIIKESNEDLIELIADTTEKLCGYKPNDEIVELFIASNVQHIEYPRISKLSIKPSKSDNASVSENSQKNNNESNLAYKQISSFNFLGKKYPAKTWKDLLVQITNLMLSLHPDQFSKVLSLSGRKRPYFSKNPEELRFPEKINHTDFFIETNMSATHKMRLSNKIIQLFGYSENTLIVDYQ